MEEIFTATFESGALPAGWTEQRGLFSFEQDALRSGRVAVLQAPLPGHGFHKLRVEVEASRVSGLGVACGNPRAMLHVDAQAGYHCLQRYGAVDLASNSQAIPLKDGRYQFSFEFDRSRLSAAVDDVAVLSAFAPGVDCMADSLHLTFFGDCLVHQVRVFGESPLSAPRYKYPDRKTDDFHLQVTVDFMDDLYYAPYTPSMFEQLFDEYCKWGVRHVHWIYKGGTRRGMWEHAGLNVWEHFQQTVQNIGSEVFPYAVKLAHERGLELHGLFKPFEQAIMLRSLPHGTDAARERGKVERIGGWIDWASDDARQRRDLIMRRKPGAFGPGTTRPFTRIELVKNDTAPAAFTAEQVRIFVSDDNRTYREYTGPIQVGEDVEALPVWEHTPCGGKPTSTRRQCRVMRFTGLDIPERFVVLKAPEPTYSFANTLVDLIHVYTDDGEDRMLTYGVHQRVSRAAYDIGTALQSRGDGFDFIDAGIEFDVLPGTPSACLCGYDAISQPYFFDGRDSVIAIARGKDDTTVACMSPAFDQTRALWLQWVQDILDDGADGVELRVRNHHSHLTWGEYGFEQPVRDAFLERYGVDIWATDDFDPAALRCLRGEQYTQFYRQAADLIRSRDRKLGLHVSVTMDCDPQVGGSMGMHFDWRTWLDEALADSVTMKEIYPRTPLAEEVLSRTRPKGVPVIFSPYANNIWGRGKGIVTLADRIRLAREGGYDGFQLYENCAVMRAYPDGQLKLEYPELRDLFRREFVDR